MAFFTVVGGCCAVGIPVANSLIGGGQSESAKSIKKCESNSQESWEQVDFSGEKTSNICWTVDPQNPPNNVSSITEEQKYSDLFKATWDNEEGAWNYIKLKDTNEEFWTSWCEYAAHKGWSAPDKNNTTDNKYYLGICKKGEDNGKAWVEIDGKDQKKLTIKLCQGSCWSDQQGSETQSQLKSLKQPTSNNWYTVTFKKQKVTQPTSK